MAVNFLEDRISSKVRDLPDPAPVPVKVVWHDPDLEEDDRTGTVCIRGDMNDASFCLRLLSIAREREIVIYHETCKPKKQYPAS